MLLALRLWTRKKDVNISEEKPIHMQTSRIMFAMQKINWIKPF